MIRLILILLGSLILGNGAAHPLPKLRYDRTIHVELSSNKVKIRYMLEMSELTLALDGGPFIRDKDLGKNRSIINYAEVYVAKKSPIIADNLNAKLNGRRLNFKLVSGKPKRDGDHLRIEFIFEATWQPSMMELNRVTFNEENYEDRDGIVVLKLLRNPDIHIVNVVEPTDLHGKSPIKYGPGDAERALRLSTAFRLKPSNNSNNTASLPAMAYHKLRLAIILFFAYSLGLAMG